MGTPAVAPISSLLEEKLNRANGRSGRRWGVAGFTLLGVAGLTFVTSRLVRDLSVIHNAPLLPFLLLGLALFIALGFEFVNGFHDTANAVATVIYTHSLEPHIAVMWSGVWNFIGVLVSSGAVAFTIISLLPVPLILKVSQGAGYSMVFALLSAAILWNLATWWRGLPASSSHTMIGSIVGVGVAYQLMQGGSGADGLDWAQLMKVGKALLISPVLGFCLAGLLFFVFKAVARDPRLYKAPEGDAPPPFYIRALLILTCTGVSFFHGSNDGQKGMGLIMLILVGTVPTAYALNHTVGAGEVARFAAISTQVSGVLSHYTQAESPAAAAAEDPGVALERFLGTRKLEPATLPALARQVEVIRAEVAGVGPLGSVPGRQQANIRNQMYLASETLQVLPKAGQHFRPDEEKTLGDYRKFLDRSTKYIPTWVKVAVALALGLGTMVGWKRIVVTVGEKIGKTHLTYAQGAAAEITAMVTIGLADGFGLPVSTTHVLSSGVAGTMAANHSGLQWRTLRSIAMAWFFTLPAAALLSGSLFWLFHHLAG